MALPYRFSTKQCQTFQYPDDDKVNKDDRCPTS